MVGHLSGEYEHCCTYSSEDGILGFCDHTKKKSEFEFGRTYRHYRIGSKIYKSKKAFLAALKDYKP